MRKEIRIAGFGGQGIGLSGYILGKALALYEGLNAVMTQSYGPEARGGASSASIVLSDRDIAYPFVERPDCLIVLSLEAYNKFQASLKPEGLLIIDSDLVAPANNTKLVSIRATHIAEGLGARIAANMVILGFFSKQSEIVRLDSLNRAVETTVPSKFIDLNLNAAAAGYEYAAVGESIP